MKKSFFLWAIFIIFLIMLSKTYGQMATALPRQGLPPTSVPVPAQAELNSVSNSQISPPLGQLQKLNMQQPMPSGQQAPSMPYQPQQIPQQFQQAASAEPAKLGPEQTVFASPVQKNVNTVPKWQWSEQNVQPQNAKTKRSAAPEGKIPVKFYQALTSLNLDRIKLEFNKGILEKTDALGDSMLSIVLREYEAEQSGPNEISENQFKLIISWLLEQGAGVNGINNGGKTPLVYAAEIGSIELVKLLLQNNANVNGAHDGKRLAYTPLMAAAFNGHPEVVADLLRAKANLLLSDTQGLTALMYGVKSDNIQVIDELIKAADKSLKQLVNMQDKSGMTALMYATVANKKDLVQELLKAGADKSIKNKLGKTAGDIARDNKITDLVGLL